MPITMDGTNITSVTWDGAVMASVVCDDVVVFGSTPQLPNLISSYGQGWSLPHNGTTDITGWGNIRFTIAPPEGSPWEGVRVWYNFDGLTPTVGSGLNASLGEDIYVPEGITQLRARASKGGFSNSNVFFATIINGNSLELYAEGVAHDGNDIDWTYTSENIHWAQGWLYQNYWLGFTLYSDSILQGRYKFTIAGSTTNQGYWWQEWELDGQNGTSYLTDGSIDENEAGFNGVAVNEYSGIELSVFSSREYGHFSVRLEYLGI